MHGMKLKIGNVGTKPSISTYLNVELLLNSFQWSQSGSFVLFAASVITFESCFVLKEAVDDHSVPHDD